VRMGEGEFEKALLKARHDYRGGEVLIAPYRINVMSWVDVAEDVAIALGYNKLPREVPPLATTGSRHPVERKSAEVRKALLSMGFTELANYILTQDEILRPFYDKYATLRNPISERYNAVRNSIVPQLLKNASAIRRGEVKIFEIGDVVLDGRTVRAMAFLISKNGVTLTDGLSVVKSLCKYLGLRCSFREAEEAWCIRGRCAIVEGDISGVVGEVHPEVLDKFEHYVPTVVCQIFL